MDAVSPGDADNQGRETNDNSWNSSTKLISPALLDPEPTVVEPRTLVRSSRKSIYFVGSEMCLAMGQHTP